MTDRNRPLFMISVAAELSGLHPQTLRIYETRGLVTPQRSSGNTRLYSQADIDRLELVGELTAEGINLAGVLRIIDMQRRLDELDEENERLRRLTKKLEQRIHEYEIRNKITALAKTKPQAIQVVDNEQEKDKPCG
ncbi:MAG: helix-turn-helix transcriptional regulator [Coriobacteriia bacterium]|nr:helix-turn-helix transcriptional regulator [Coriobacteriia bacterium]